MELADLRVFKEVVRAGGIIRASESLHRAQSSVTARIKQLEEKLGERLFVREGRRMQLTPAGRVLLVYADRLLELAKEAAEAVKAEQPSGKLRLGAMESTAAVRLPEPLGAFHDAYPDIALELYSGDPRDLINQVLMGELDAALIADPVADKRLESVAVYEEELVVVAEARHPAIKSAKDVPSRTLLAFHHGCPHRRRLEDWFHRSHVSPNRVVEVGSYHLILGCAAIGMGVALVPRSVLTTYSKCSRLSIHELPKRFRSAVTRLIWRKEAPQAKIQGPWRRSCESEAIRLLQTRQGCCRRHVPGRDNSSPHTIALAVRPARKPQACNATSHAAKEVALRPGIGRWPNHHHRPPSRAKQYNSGQWQSRGDLPRERQTPAKAISSPQLATPPESLIALPPAGSAFFSLVFFADPPCQDSCRPARFDERQWRAVVVGR